MKQDISQKGLLIFILKAGIGIAVLIFLLTKIEWHLLIAAFSKILIEHVLVALLVFILSLLAESIRLFIVFRKYSVTFLSALRINIIGSVFGVFTPGQVGSDVYKVCAVSDRGRGLVQPALLIMFVRLCGILILMLSFLFSVSKNGVEFEELLLTHDAVIEITPQFTVIMYVIISVIVLLPVILFISKSGSYKFSNGVTRIRSAYREAKTCLSWGSILMVLLLTLFIMLFRVLILDNLILAIGHDLQFDRVLFVVVLAMIGTMLPISISGIGVREAIIVVLLFVFFIPYEEATAVALISRAFLLITAVSGIVWMNFSSNNNGKEYKEDEGIQ